MEARNLTEENVDDLKANLLDMQKENPALEFREFKVKKEDFDMFCQQQETIIKKLDDLNAKLQMIFGDSALVDGRFVDVNADLKVGAER